MNAINALIHKWRMESREPGIDKPWREARAEHADELEAAMLAAAPSVPSAGADEPSGDAWYCTKDGEHELGCVFFATNPKYKAAHPQCNWQDVPLFVIDVRAHDPAPAPQPAASGDGREG